MTIKQLLVGSAIGATAVGIMLHRCMLMPKQSVPVLKADIKPVQKISHREGHARVPRNENDERLSMNKLFGHRN